ncbi:hypothetical protein [Nonomuraea sp. NPDC052265]|uniref:hypothetical protein n=1 Tax=Nonomuraea sp. NPDC052265 TaxID=3364374 RepID=UPI0037CA9E8E
MAAASCSAFICLAARCSGVSFAAPYTQNDRPASASRTRNRSLVAGPRTRIEMVSASACTVWTVAWCSA